MTALRRLTVEVPEDLASEIDAEIAAGGYADAEQFVIQSIESRLHPDRYPTTDPTIEQWLVAEVGPTYDAYKANPGRLMTEEEAFDEIDRLTASPSDQV